MSIERIEAFFDARAAGWDAGVEAGVLERAGEIVRELEIAPGSRVLDVGCGTGPLVPMLREQMGGKGLVVETDLSMNMLREGRKKFGGDFTAFFQSDAGAPAVRVGVFDWVLCYSVFPHFLDQRGVLVALAGLLKPGGRLAVFHSKSREGINAFHRKVGGEVGGHELPDEGGMRALFEAAGLTVERFEDRTGRYLVVGVK